MDIKRPYLDTCSMEGCKRDVFILVGGESFCERHSAKFSQHRNKNEFLSLLNLDSEV